MGKFKSTLVTAARTEKEEKQEQERLHQKHHIEDENIKVVEKSNMVKFMVRTSAGMLRCTSMIVLFSLAVLGGMALVYPNVRNELFAVLLQIWMELQAMI